MARKLVLFRKLKSDYVLPWNVVGQANIARVINSDEVQTILKANVPKITKRQRVLKKNPSETSTLTLSKVLVMKLGKLF